MCYGDDATASTNSSNGDDEQRDLDLRLFIMQPWPFTEIFNTIIIGEIYFRAV